MIRKTGNMWSAYDQADRFLITTNSSIRQDGSAVLGAGMAKQARDRFDGLAQTLGSWMEENGGHLGTYGTMIHEAMPQGGKIGLFQVKHHWQEEASLELIETSAKQLREYCRREPTERVHLNFPGIGNGGLDPEDVLPILQKHLPRQVHVWTYEELECEKTDGQHYTGVGSRDTPPDVQELMTNVARCLAALGWTLRSGAAKGADSAFEQGARGKEIYLPWSGYNDRYPKERGVYLGPDARQDPEARRIARDVHPAWEQMSQGAQKLHGRNAHQVLGRDLESPSDLLICWTPDGAESGEECSPATGGTGTAIRLASDNNIPVHNLQRPKRQDRYRDWVEEARQ